jgi:peptidyl-prolyl cis-trans isomerase A (cyclophilin A)
MKRLLQMGLLVLCVGGFFRAGAQTEITYYTNMGNFKAMLTDTLTPRTVDSFKARVIHKFYDGLIFHRVIDNFMIQGGDPLGTGYGGPGYSTPDEIDTPTLKNLPAALAMANSGPNTNGSQFYINLVNNAYLNGSYTVFGMVTTGFSVVQSIGHVATNSSNRPLTNVVMDSVMITKWPAAVNNLSKELAVTMAPNPCAGLFTIGLPEVVTTVHVINVSGQVVYQTLAKGSVTVDLRNQPAGIYIVSGYNNNGSFEQRLVVQ